MAGTYVSQAELTVSDGTDEVTDSVTVTVAARGNVGPPGDDGTGDGTVAPPGGGTPRLHASVKPKRTVVGPGKKRIRFRFRVANVGDGDSGPINLCAKAPMKTLKINGKRCERRPSLAPGQTIERRIKVKIKPKARGKSTRIRFVASGSGFESQRKVVRLRARG